MTCFEVNIILLILLEQPTLTNCYTKHIILLYTKRIRLNATQTNETHIFWTFLMISTCIAMNPHFTLHLPRILRKLSFARRVTLRVHTCFPPLHCKKPYIFFFLILKFYSFLRIEGGAWSTSAPLPPSLLICLPLSVQSIYEV
jgi:hypothetical protein